MMKSMTREKWRIVLQVLLGLLLLWAAVSKIAKPIDFLGSVYAYELPLPRPLLRFVAVFLPWTELICGLLLISGVALDAALLLVTSLFVMFVAATAQAWARGLAISCGCFDLEIFGLGKRFPELITFLESVGFAFFRNLILTGLAFFLLRRSLEPSGDIPIAAALPPGLPSQQPKRAKWSSGRR
jgi:putative oxidoreductase